MSHLKHHVARNPSHSEGPKLLDMLKRKEDGKVVLNIMSVVGCKLWK